MKEPTRKTLQIAETVTPAVNPGRIPYIVALATMNEVSYDDALIAAIKRKVGELGCSDADKETHRS